MIVAIIWTVVVAVGVAWLDGLLPDFKRPKSIQTVPTEQLTAVALALKEQLIATGQWESFAQQPYPMKEDIIFQELELEGIGENYISRVKELAGILTRSHYDETEAGFNTYPDPYSALPPF